MHTRMPFTCQHLAETMRENAMTFLKTSLIFYKFSSKIIFFILYVLIIKYYNKGIIYSKIKILYVHYSFIRLRLVQKFIYPIQRSRAIDDQYDHSKFSSNRLANLEKEKKLAKCFYQRNKLRETRRGFANYSIFHHKSPRRL